MAVRKAPNQVQGSGLHPGGQVQLNEHRVRLGAKGRASRGAGLGHPLGSPTAAPRSTLGHRAQEHGLCLGAVEDPGSSPRGREQWYKGQRVANLSLDGWTEKLRPRRRPSVP